MIMMSRLEYTFAYLPKSNDAFSAYLKALGVPVRQVLRPGLMVQMKTHWYTYRYICETDNAVCLSWDASPEDCHSVDDQFYIFWVPKVTFQKDWRRSLKIVGDPLGYFLHEQADPVTRQMDLFRMLL